MTTTFPQDELDTTAWVWLRVGLDVSSVPRSARRRLPHESRLECVTRVLRACGNSVRERSLRASNLANVPVGTIVQLSPTSELAVVARATADGLWLESEREQRCVTRGELAHLSEATALDWHPAARGAPLHVLARIVLARRESRRGLALFLLLSVVGRLLALGVPFLLRAVLTQSIPNGLTTSLVSIGVGLAVLGAMIAALGLARDHALRYLESHALESCQRELFRCLQELPYRVVAQRPPLFEWQQLSRFGRWAQLEVEWLVSCLDAALGVPFLVAAAFISLPAAAAAAAFSLVCLLAAWCSARAQASRLGHVVEAREHKHEAVHALVHGMELVRTDGLRSPMLAELERRTRLEHRGDLAVADWRGVTVGVASLAERAAWLVPFCVLGWQCMVGSASLATCIASIQLVSVFAISVRDTVRAIDVSAQIRSLETFAMAWAPVPSSPEPCGEPAPGYAIEVREASFRYREDAPWVLKDFSLKMRRGEHRVLGWPSGAGKTTLLRLVAGVYEPERGVALVRRRPGGARDVCYVPQTTPLLEDTLKENLSHLSGGAPPERIAEAARRTGLDELVATWPMGWETMLSGRVLSSGQRQLVTMTAVLASEASIILLDETTAHLDAALRSRLAGAFDGRTVLTVDHRHDPASARVQEDACNV